jgi:hypothetical protein
LRTALMAAERELATYQQHRRRFAKSPRREEVTPDNTLPSIPPSLLRPSPRTRKATHA